MESVQDRMPRAYRKGALLCATILAGMGGAALPAHAQSAGNALQNWANQKYMTGDWGGARTSLKDKGIDIFGSYVSMFAGNPSGGMKQTSTYAEQFLLGATFDLGKLAGLQGGQFHFVVNERLGNGLSTYGIGNQFQVQAIYGDGATFRLTNFSYSQTFDDKRIFTQVGFFPQGDYFAYTPDFLTLQNGAFNAHPVAIAINTGWIDAPAGRWGGMIKYNFLPGDVYVQTGIWDVKPEASLANHGFDIQLNHSTGFIVPVQIGDSMEPFGHGLIGHISLGGYYDSSSPIASASGTSESYTGRYGGYIQLDQTLWQSSSDPARKLTGYLTVLGQDARTAKVPAFFTLALIKKGTFEGRDRDLFEVSAYAARVNPRAIDHQKQLLAQRGINNFPLQMGEYGLQMGYTYAMTRWWMVTPNVQYIINPGAFSYKHISNATVLGVATSVVF